MRTVAIIPARGGSKRIPGKNIVEFQGKPMLAWAIERALKADVFADVFVSTDSEEVAKVARKFGAKVPFLRDHHADDHSTVSEATCWTLRKLVKELSVTPDFVVQMMANVPLTRPETVRLFHEELAKEPERSLISCFEPRFSPLRWAIEKGPDGSGRFVFDEFSGKRSQDMPPLLIPTGAIWGASRNYLETHGDFYGPSFRLFEVDWLEALDIDTPEELEICRALAGVRSC